MSGRGSEGKFVVENGKERADDRKTGVCCTGAKLASGSAISFLNPCIVLAWSGPSGDVALPFPVTKLKPAVDRKVPRNNHTERLSVTLLA